MKYLLSIFLFLVSTQVVIGQSVTGPQHSGAPLNFTDGSTSCYPYQVSVGSLSCSNGVATLSSGATNVGIGTTNRPVVFTSSTTAGPSGKMFDDGTNVGIGTIAPRTAVELGVQAMNIVGPNIGIGTTTPQGSLVITNGNVGIGTWAPKYYLDSTRQARIAGSSGPVGTIAGTDYSLSLQNNASTVWLEILNNGGIGKGAFFGMSGNDFEQYNYQGGNIKFFTNPSASSSTERMRITSGGNVGIGSAAPGNLLDVFGNVRLANSGNLTVGGTGTYTGSIFANSQVNSNLANAPDFNLYGTGTDYGQLQQLGNNIWALGYNTSQTANGTVALQWQKGASIPILTIPTGNLGIGTAGPQFPLQVNGNVGIGTTVNSGPKQLVINNVATFNSEYSYASNIGVGTTTIDWNNGNAQNIGIGTSQGAYLAFTHPVNGSSSTLNLRIKQDATGSRVVSFWPSTVLWAGGTAPTLTTTANKSDFITCKWNGTSDYCVPTQNF